MPLSMASFSFTVVFLLLLKARHSTSTSLSTMTQTIMTRHTWNWRGHPIVYYEKNSNRHGREAVLLLNGFGVGSFHQELLMQAFNDTNDESSFNVYAMDYLGQGASWPVDCDDGRSVNEQGLRYCGTTWVQQIVDFIQTQFTTDQQVHLVGNSVGGHLSVFVANQLQQQNRIASICLLNATPLWGMNLPGWSGRLPAPILPKIIGQWAFDQMRNKRIIQLFLQNCYWNQNAFDDELVEQIHDCTTASKGGHAAFASILWSPPVSTIVQHDNEKKRVKQLSFHENLSHLSCPVLLLFGEQDPWCTPAIAQQMLHHLPTTAQYCELSQVGHCPNHEAPRAVATVLQLFWNQQQQSEQDDERQLLDQPLIIHERWGVTTVTQKSNVPLNWIEKQILSYQTN